MNALQYQDVEELEEFVQEGYHIGSPNEATWALRKISALNKQIAETEKDAIAEIDRIQIWLADNKKSAQRSIEFFEASLTEYLLEQRSIDPDFKINSPYGKVTTKKQQDEYIFTDDAITGIKDVGGLDMLVKSTTKESIIIRDFKALVKSGDLVVTNNLVFTKDGNQIEGVTINKRDDKVVISAL